MGTRPDMLSRMLAGAAAGAAGTTALNAVTFLDMALTARPASSTPQRSIERAAERAGLGIPGSDAERDNRLQGLGSLGGAATGVVAGMAMGLARAAGVRPGVLAGSVLAGLAAMAAGNAPMMVLGVTDPRRWSAKQWVSDAAPHLAYGAVTYATLVALDGRR